MKYQSTNTKKKILCFGDSNTYGYIPSSGKRYDKHTRWTGVLQELCKDDYEIIEAGCNNRTAFTDNPDGIMQTGYKILPEYLKDKPDIVILALGINDLQKFYNPCEEKIKRGIENLIKLCSNTQVILIAPPKLSKDVLNGAFSFQFDETSIKKSCNIGKIYKKAALENNIKFINLDDYIKVSEIDGLHFEPKMHKIIAQTVFKNIS